MKMKNSIMESGEWLMDTEYWYVQYQRTSYGIRTYVQQIMLAVSHPDQSRRAHISYS